MISEFKHGHISHHFLLFSNVDFKQINVCPVTSQKYDERLLKAKIHCGIFLSDYFTKRSLMHISLHLI